jgi:hypothetical protein
VAGSEVLPVLSLSEQLPEFVVADTTTSPWSPYSGLLDRDSERGLNEAATA